MDNLIILTIFRQSIILGWTMPPKFSLVKLLRQKLLPEEQNVNFVLQDLGFKLEDLKHALEFIHKETEVYPIWLCPTRHLIAPGLEEFSSFKKRRLCSLF